MTRTLPSLPSLFGISLLLGLISFMSVGCGPTSLWPKAEVRVSTKKQSTLMAKADQAMLEGRYNDARQAYAQLLEANGRGAPASIARYGLACIALITAEDTAEYDQSLDLFMAWAANDPSTFYNGDPRHLVPLLKKHQNTLQRLKRSTRKVSDCREEYRALMGKYDSLSQEHKALQERTTFLEARRSDLQKQQQSLEEQIRVLEQKITELEELYNQLQDARENL